jgi:hypothetical protein
MAELRSGNKKALVGFPFVNPTYRLAYTEGIEQLESYLAHLGLHFGWLFVFDRRKIPYQWKNVYPPRLW